MYEDAHLEAAYEDKFLASEYPSFAEDDDPDCICGEPADGEMAEVYNPNDPAAEAVVCHVSCIPEGYTIA